MKKNQSDVINDPKLFKERKNIEWDPKNLPPLLALPSDDKDPSKLKFDFASVRKKPFQFDVPAQEEEKPAEIDPKDDFETISEDKEKDGYYDAGFDAVTYEKTRQSIPYVKFIPYLLRIQEPALRSPEQFSESEKVKDFSGLVSGNPSVVTYICIADARIEKKQLKELPKLVCNFPKLECLILRNIGLKDVSGFVKNFPEHVKYVDFSRNNIQEMKYVTKMFMKAPYMEHINLTDNPVVQKPNFREKILATNASLTLRVVNETEVNIEERLKSFEKYGTKQQKNEIPLIRWDLTICSLPEIKAMRLSKQFRPEYITKISFPQMNLVLFHVGDFKNVESIDLSNNKITDLRGMGLEHCSKLSLLNLRQNLITKKESLKAFCFMPALRMLFLEGNNELGSYRPLVIWLTRNLKGDNRAPGLSVLDGKVITIEERVTAASLLGKKENLDALRWQLNLIQYYGHYQIKEIKDFFGKVRHLRLQSKNLQVLNIKAFQSLEVLDVRGNNLRTIEGIECLVRLKVLIAANNPKLSLRETLPKLAKTNSLEQVSFGLFNQKDKDHKLFYSNTKYRLKVLKNLLFNNPNLRFLDGILISLEQRVEAYKLLGATNEQAETYRFHLALNNNATMPWNRRYHYLEVGIGNQYDPVVITVLRRLNNVGIISSVCNFAQFVNLEELNLSGNKLTTIHKMGLEKLEKLRVLDVSKNQIDTPLKDLAAFFDKFDNLEILAIRENPCARTYADKLALIGLMLKMRQVNCQLRVIDTEVSLDERVEAWRKSGGQEEEVELLRWKAIVFQRAPKDIAIPKITSLDLSNGGLQHLNLSEFVSLEVLLLKNNRIKSLTDISGLHLLKNLKVLDIRKNQLSKLEEVAKVIVDLPSLASIGLKGNKFDEKDKNWRHKLLTLLPQLHEQYMALRMIDSVPLTCLEIVKAWKVSSDSSPDRVAWQVIQLLKLPKDAKAADVTELDMSGNELQMLDIDLSDYVNLQKLSLANNNIKTLESANIDKLKELRALDLSGNKIKDLTPVINLVNRLPKIEMIFVHNNPCWNEEEDRANRVKFLGQIAQMDHLGATLKYLNGFPITISERCRGLAQAQVYNAEGLARFRIELLWEHLAPKESTDAINVSGSDIDSIKDLAPRLLNLPNLRHLDLSNNKISSPEELKKVLDNCIRLTSLDLRDNVLECHVLEVVDLVRSLCPAIQKLWLERSTKGRDSAKPREYLNSVFTKIPTLQTVDGHPHPQNELVRTGRPQKSSIFQVFDQDTLRNSLMPDEPTDASLSGSTGSLYNSNGMYGTGRRDSNANDSSNGYPGTNGYPGPHGYPNGNGYPPPSNGHSNGYGYNPELSATTMSDRLSTAYPEMLGGNYTIYPPLYPMGPAPSAPSAPPDFDDKPIMSTSFASLAASNPGSTLSTDSLYPDLIDFSEDNYLPKDYHKTIGRNYDISELAKQLSLQAEQDDDKDDN